MLRTLTFVEYLLVEQYSPNNDPLNDLHRTVFSEYRSESSWQTLSVKRFHQNSIKALQKLRRFRRQIREPEMRKSTRILLIKQTKSNIPNSNLEDIPRTYGFDLKEVQDWNVFKNEKKWNLLEIIRNHSKLWRAKNKKGVFSLCQVQIGIKIRFSTLNSFGIFDIQSCVWFTINFSVSPKAVDPGQTLLEPYLRAKKLIWFKPL